MWLGLVASAASLAASADTAPSDTGIVVELVGGSVDRDGDGWTIGEGDCYDNPDDPAAASVSPDMAERCDDLFDNDCNGLYNDGCENLVGYASVSGGGGCGVVPRAGRAWFLGVFLLVGRRRC